MNQEIAETFAWMKTNNKDLERLTNVIEKSLPPALFEKFTLNLNHKYERVFEKTKRRHIMKFDIIANVPEPTQNLDHSQEASNDNWLTNLSGIEIPPYVKDILKLGEKYNPPVSNTDLPFEKIISSVESAFFYMDDADQ